MSPVVQMLGRALDWYLAHRNGLELVGLLLSVLGTLFAVMSIRDGQKMTNDLRAVFDHLTTKECGTFPSYMKEVERLIGEARESIFVATDFPAHGVWTDRGEYGSYVKTLENRKAELARARPRRPGADPRRRAASTPSRPGSPRAAGRST
jgi:hypothetical protein